MRGTWLVAFALIGCDGSAATSESTASAPSTTGDETASEATSAGSSEIALERETVTCRSGGVGPPAMPAGGCTAGVSTVVAVSRRVRGALPDLAASCSGSGEVVVRFAVEGDGTVSGAAIVSTTAEADVAERTRSLIAGIAHCEIASGERAVFVLPLALR